MILLSLQAIQSEILAREPEIRSLLEKGQKIFDQSPPTSDIADFTNKLDTAKSEWRKLREKATEKNAKLKEAVKQSEKFYSDLNTMSAWLDITEEKLASLDSVTLQPDVLARQLDEAQLLEANIKRQSRDNEILKSEAEGLMNMSDVDGRIVADQLQKVEARWDKLSSGENKYCRFQLLWLIIHSISYFCLQLAWS